MRGDRPPYGEIVDSVGHKRIGVTVPRKRTVPHTNSVIERSELRQPVMPVTVFFFEAPRTVLDAAADADIEAAVVSSASAKAVEKRTIGDATDGVDPEGDGCRDIRPLVRQAGPAALRTEIVGHRIGTSHPSKLRIRRSATERHG